VNTSKLIKILLISELVITAFVALAALRRTVFAGNKGNTDRRRIQADWVRQSEENKAEPDNSKEELKDDAGPAYTDPDSIARSVDLLDDGYDDETMTGSSYQLDYPQEILDRLAKMSEAEKVETLIISVSADEAEDSRVKAELYNGLPDADEVAASINAGDTFLYAAEDPEGLKETLTEAAQSGEILAEALDKAAGHALPTYDLIATLRAEAEAKAAEEAEGAEQEKEEALKKEQAAKNTQSKKSQEKKPEKTEKSDETPEQKAAREQAEAIQKAAEEAQRIQQEALEAQAKKMQEAAAAQANAEQGTNAEQANKPADASDKAETRTE
jgi:hypothetical protein